MTAVHPLPSLCDGVALDEPAIRRRVQELGAQITADFAGEDLRLVTVLRGGLFFLADLSRSIDLDVHLDFFAVTPYVPGGGGSVRVTKDLDDSVQGAAVLVVEDVIDTGLTLSYVLKLLQGQGPSRLEVCALLDKPMRRIVPIDTAYTGFTVSDRFLVGYGLDFHGRYRNLPYLASVRPDVVL